MIVSLAGKSGSGKDYCATVLEQLLRDSPDSYMFDTFSVQRYAYANNLKEMCYQVTGFKQHKRWYWPEYKDRIYKHLSLNNCTNEDFVQWVTKRTYSSEEALRQQMLRPRSPRWWMQNYSDFLKTIHGERYFVTLLMQQLMNESWQVNYQIITDMRYLVESVGHTVWVENPDNKLSEKHLHNSEQLTAKDCSYIIHNSYTTSSEDIQQQWKEILKDIEGTM